MKVRQLWQAVGLAGAISLLQLPLAAQEEAAEPEVRRNILVGAEIGGTGALAPMERFVKNGAVFSPFVAYMFHDLIGAMGNFHLLAIPNKDAFDDLLEDDVTWAIGGTVGPRFALPLGGIEIWGTWQGGIFTGLTPHGAITDTSWGFSTGGGANLALTKTFSFGGFARYNRLYQRVHGRGDARYATGGIVLTFKFSPPAAGPPPAK